MRAFAFGSYNWQGRNFDDEQDRDEALQRQLATLADRRADAWAFQGCSRWSLDGGRLLFQAEQILGLRGFLARSRRSADETAVFVRESGGIRVIAERHEHGHPFWHAIARLAVATPWPGVTFHLVSVHLAPTSPAIRLAEAEALAAIVEEGLMLAGGSWNAFSAADPEPSPAETGYDRRVLDRSAAYALEEAGYIDAAGHLRDHRPTVGHAGGLRYRSDRIYSTFPAAAIMSYEVIEEYEPVSSHRPLVATFDLESAQHAP